MRMKSTIILFSTFMLSKVFKRLVLGGHPPSNLLNTWYSRGAVEWLRELYSISLSEKKDLCLTLNFYLVSSVRFFRLSFLTAFLVDCCAGYLIIQKFSEVWLTGSFLCEELQEI